MNRESLNIWLFHITNVVVGILVFLLILIPFKEKLGLAPPKKKIKYRDEKRAKFCKRLIVSGMLIIVCISIIILYLGFLLPENEVLNILGFQSPIQWLLLLTFLFGFLIGVLGLRMVLHGALEQIK